MLLWLLPVLSSAAYLKHGMYSSKLIYCKKTWWEMQIMGRSRVYLWSCTYFLLFYLFFLLYSLFKNSTECQLFKYDFKRAEKLFYYVYDFLKAYLYTELEITRRNVASYFSFSAQLYTHFWERWQKYQHF